MKIYSVLVFVLTVTIFSCAGKKRLARNIIRDGSSYEKAIVINETHERAGVDDEYIWIRNNYPNATTKSQVLTYYEDTPYDMLNIVTADGKTLKVYFDISNFYGHL